MWIKKKARNKITNHQLVYVATDKNDEVTVGGSSLLFPLPLRPRLSRWTKEVKKNEQKYHRLLLGGNDIRMHL